MTTISDKAATALKAAVATRGKHKGQLLAKCPPSNTLAAAAWQGAVMAINPYKVSIGAVLFMSSEQKAIFHEVEAALKGCIHLDRDRSALQALGVW